MIVQMAKMLGAHVIGTVGDEEKAKQAKDAGADEVIIYTKEDFSAKAKGVHVVYDSVGQSTFMKSLDCLRPRGMMVSFGNASGPVENFAPLILSQKGSLFLTRPDAGKLHCDRGRAGLARQRRVEVAGTRQAEIAHPQGISAFGRRPGASRSGRPQDDRKAAAPCRLIAPRIPFGELKIDALLVSAPPNVRYLSGFTGDNGLLLVTPGDTPNRKRCSPIRASPFRPPKNAPAR